MGYGEGMKNLLCLSIIDYNKCAFKKRAIHMYQKLISPFITAGHLRRRAGSSLINQVEYSRWGRMSCRDKTIQKWYQMLEAVPGDV